MAPGVTKGEGAFRTIGELSDDLGVPQHILRYWESRFPQLRPLQRAGKRRYYRPTDVALVKRIDQLLNKEGYTIRGVQKLLGERAPAAAAPAQQDEGTQPATLPALPSAARAELWRIRAALAKALEE